jgi:ubiquinone/menaquinone biosynthesis C-methylase UbiE
MSKDFIKDFWNNQAKKFGESPEASWGDIQMVNLEIETIGHHLRRGETVLDIGCANGYAAFRHAKKLKRIMGVDFAEEMIREANKAKKNATCNNISFEMGDVRKLQFKTNSFDMVYTTRVLINLPTWADQIQGIKECIRVTKPGGKILLSEAFWEPLMLMNALRILVGLPSLVEHDFNRYLKKDRLNDLLKSLGLKFKIDDFSSVYYLGSRFLRELVTNPNDYVGYSNPINKLFYDIERKYSGGGFGVQQLYVIKKPKN